MKLRNYFFSLLILLPLFFPACDIAQGNGAGDDNGNDDDALPTGILQPADLVYQGAFRLPGGTFDKKSWEWGGHSMTYYPEGDPNGPDDGYPGSIFATGHAHEMQVSEINIPAPKISSTKNLAELNTASTLQGFQDILDVSNLEMPRSGLEYLPKQGAQTTARLYFCWGYHLQEEPPALTHGWCELDLANPNIQKGWFLAGHPICIRNMSTNDYLFEIPANWAAAYVPRKRLATGRFRDGGWSGQGPSVFAIGPWNQGNPPAPGTALENITLLLYTSTCDFDEENHTMKDYHHSDEWNGGAWLTAGNKAALLFAGTKGFGDCWYGNEQGPCLSCENRGWWSTGFKGQFIFYNPADLADVAAGKKKPYEPQPYASLDIDEYLYSVHSSQQKNHLGAICFDRARGIIYVCEFRGDGDNPLIHAWKIKK